MDQTVFYLAMGQKPKSGDGFLSPEEEKSALDRCAQNGRKGCVLLSIGKEGTSCPNHPCEG